MPEIKLRPLTLDDTSNVVRWRNNDFVRCNLFNQEFLTEQQHIAYFNKSIITGLIKQYIIVTSLTNEDIGTVFFKNVDYKNNKAEVGIFIGEKAFLGGGYGTAALRSSLAIAFLELKMNKVYATIMEENNLSRKLFTKVGFIESGLLLEDYLSNDGYKNIVFMELTAKIYKNHSAR